MLRSPWFSRRFALFAALILPLAMGTSLFAQTKSTLELRDGDRIALLGGTFIERAQMYGYFELALQIANPDKHLAVRNLGWSGDEATGISRARFGNQQEGYNHLMNSVDLVKPSVILVGYGTNEAFQGEAGLEAFKSNYTKLLDDLKKRTERIVLITPPEMEKHPAPLPDPAEYNANVKLYQKAIEQLAYDRGYQVLDLTSITKSAFDKDARWIPSPMTSNGQHFTETGYWFLSRRMASQLGFGNALRYQVREDSDRSGNWELPYPRSPEAKKQDAVSLRLIDFPAGNYTVGINDYPQLKTSLKQGNTTLTVPAQPLTQKTEELRQTILRKNQLFFDRFRPQNETYLYLFRKHEQGNNAVEIPQFDPLIEEQDQKIFELKQPVPVTLHID